MISSKFKNCYKFCSKLTALSPIDGRYSTQIHELKDYYSEASLIKYRTIVEIEWVKFLLKEILDENQLKNKYKIRKNDILPRLDIIGSNFDITCAEKVKEIETKTNHDVKAVEYYIKSQFKTNDIPESLYELVHFCCTSEDINNIAHSLMLKDSLAFVYHQRLTFLINQLVRLAEENYNLPMMSRTHGQPATPTTVGKEIANFAFRLNEQHYILKGKGIKAKINGAVGNYNAHMIVLPNVNWFSASQTFIESLGLEFNPYTTQIENHDSISDIFNSASLINTILTGMSRDFWTYISLNYFKQKLKKDEVGSSTMPHKVNPIDFENAEGNLGLANALFNHMSGKLPISRMQRDLTDSTVLRNVGSAFGYSLIAFKSLDKGLNKLEPNREVILNDLDNHWELLAEPLQTVMRYHGHANPYELLKDLTRGKKFSKEDYLKLVSSLDLPIDAKKVLLDLSPSNYIGKADYLAKNIRSFIK